MRVRLLYNPTAGRGRASHRIRRAVEILQHLGADVTVSESNSREHLVQLGGALDNREYDRIIICGGDGTLHLAIQELDLACTVGIVPAGSGDDFAKTLGISENLESACTTAVGSMVREVDVATANSRRFLGVAGVGFDSIVAAHANTVKRLRGSLVYLYSIFRVLPTFKPLPMTITRDGDAPRNERVMFAVIGNSPRYGGGIRIAPAAQVDDGVLDAYVIHECTKLDLIKTLPRAYTGKHVTSQFVESMRGEHFRFETHDTLDVYADGELLTTTPVTFALLPQKLKIAAP